MRLSRMSKKWVGRTSPATARYAPLYAGIATVAKSAAQPPPHSLDPDEQQRGADCGNADRAKHIPQQISAAKNRVGL
jgi:hypothetical protein